MELRHLRYFVAVAEELNFTHAAERLHVAQPALSSQIRDLEHELQTALFERRRRGVLLTRAGKTLYQRAKAILADAASAANETRTAAGVITGSLMVGFPSGLHLNYLSALLTDFRERHPKVELDFFHGLPAQQLKALREGHIDIGFINLPAALDGLRQRCVWRVPFRVVLPRKHRLARRTSFQLVDLKGEDFVFCTRESRPEFYDDFFRHCANAGFRPRILKEVGGYPTNMLGLVSVGVGVSVLPYFKDVERISGLVWRPLTKPQLWVDWALIWREGDKSSVVQEFIAAAEKAFPVPDDSARAEV